MVLHGPLEVNMTTSEKFDLNIGALVHCQDGECGKLAKVVIDPETLQVTNLIVEEGFLLKQARVFPINTVDHSGADDIYLSVKRADLGNFPEYRETEFEVPVSSRQEGFRYDGGDMLFPAYGSTYDTGLVTYKEKVRQGIMPELKVVEQGTLVINSEGVIGKLEHVITDKESGAVTDLLVRQGAIFTSELEIPASFVDRVSEDGIFVSVTNKELKDFALSRANENREKREQKQREQDVENGENILTTESELAADIMSAFMNDPRTVDSIIEVINERGVITLTGEVNSEEQREAAKEIAASYPDVVSVVNSLKIAR
jgi:uncharacterized protein YrrD